MKENETDWLDKPLFSDEEVTQLIGIAISANTQPTEAQLATFLRRCEKARREELLLKQLLSGGLVVTHYNASGEAVIVPVEHPAVDSETQGEGKAFGA